MSQEEELAARGRLITDYVDARRLCRHGPERRAEITKKGLETRKRNAAKRAAAKKKKAKKKGAKA